MKNNKGFSLVELIIVIAIMAVLVGVLAPTYLQYVEKSKKSNDVSTVDSIINAVEIGAIDPEVMTDKSVKLEITVLNTGSPTFAIVAKDKDNNDISTTSKWKSVVEAAVGTDISLKSTNWTTKNASGSDEGTAGTVKIVATRDGATGKVVFKYHGDTAGSFKAYATSLTKVKTS